MSEGEVEGDSSEVEGEDDSLSEGEVEGDSSEGEGEGGGERGDEAQFL